MYNAYVVDDEYWTLQGIIKTLGKHGDFLEYKGFSDPQEALEAMCEKCPHVVFTDVRMPVMSGFDLIREAKNRGMYDILFIIISGYDEFQYAREAIREGTVDYLTKPLDDKDVATLMTRLLERLNTAVADPEARDLSMGNTRDSFFELLKDINSNIAAKITLSGLAVKYYINATYLSELFKKYTGMGFSDYLNSRRLKLALEKMKNPSLSITEISVMCGYENPYYFTRVFKKAYGATPSDYRKRTG